MARGMPTLSIADGRAFANALPFHPDTSTQTPSFARSAFNSILCLCSARPAGGQRLTRLRLICPELPVFCAFPASGEAAMRPLLTPILFLASTALTIQAAVQCARGQTTLPEITVTPAKEMPKAKPKSRALTAKEIPAFLEAVDRYTGSPASSAPQNPNSISLTLISWRSCSVISRPPARLRNQSLGATHPMNSSTPATSHAK